MIPFLSSNITLVQSGLEFDNLPLSHQIQGNQIYHLHVGMAVDDCQSVSQ
jgi:hypothetical protein